MKIRQYQSWGGYPKADHEVFRFRWEDDSPPFGRKSVLPFGNGRSYGDSCLNDGGVLLDARGLDRLISFDPATGFVTCEAGVLLTELLEWLVPMGWFLPVTPGTKFVTVGGAIANDVHGKNHHRAGTFGSHVDQLALLRSDGRVYTCSPQKNQTLFGATIGGLGLTGLILWATIRMRRINNSFMDMETVRFGNLDEFLKLSDESDRDYEYTVAWVDCLAKKESIGRGLYMRGNHASPFQDIPSKKERHMSIPLTPPFSLVNPASLHLFNTLYYRKQWQRRRRRIGHYGPFFYPLDKIFHWNRMYGSRGFLQYQCVVPPSCGREAILEILSRIAESGIGSFLAVLKIFGNIPSPGLLSFPRPGITLALDFPIQGRKTFNLLNSLDEIVVQASGAVYPAKDARMSRESFQKFFPQWAELEKYRDPAFSSSFWRRVTGEIGCVKF